MSTERRLVLGSADGEHVIIEPRRRNYPDCSDYWDGNWIGCTIDVRAGGFRGSVNADLRTEEFVSFRDALRDLYDRLAGEAMFETMEHWLTIKIVGDGRGHFEAKCELRDDPGMGNRLEFALAFDQTDLPPVLRDLDAIVAAFPVVGRP
jgi:hypothetical protein